jgi:hypothetical protein
MNELLAKIRLAMIHESSDYQKMAEYRVQLSSLYSTLAEKSKDYVIAKADFYNKLRNEILAKKEKLTISMLDREWEMSPEGVKMEVHKITMDAVDKMISSLNQLVRIANQDYFNSKYQ